MMLFFSFLEAMAQLVIGLLIFTLTCRGIPNFFKSLHDFAFIASNIMLTCFSFYYCANSVNREVFLRSLIVLCYAIVVFLLTALLFYLCKKVTWIAPQWRRRSERVFKQHCGVRADMVDHVRLEVLRVLPTAVSTNLSAPQPVAAPQPQSSPVSVHQDASRYPEDEIVPAPASHASTNSSVPATVVTIVLSDKQHSRAAKLSVSDMLDLTVAPNASAMTHMSRAQQDLITESFPIVSSAAQPGACAGVDETDITCLSNDHLTLSWICCLMPNSIAIPLGLMQQLSSLVTWVDLSIGSIFLLMFHVICAIVDITILPIFVRRARAETEQRQLIRAALLNYRQRIQSGKHEGYSTHAAGREDASNPLDSNDAESTYYQTNHCDAAKPLSGVDARSNKSSNYASDWEDSASTMHCSDSVHTVHVRVVSESDYALLRASDLSSSSSFAASDELLFPRVRHMLFKLCVNPVILPSFIGLALGAIPHFKHILFSGALATLTDSMLLVSNGAVPAQLLLVITWLLGPSAEIAAAIAKADATPPAAPSSSTATKADESKSAAMPKDSKTGVSPVRHSDQTDTQSGASAPDCTSDNQACQERRMELPSIASAGELSPSGDCLDDAGEQQSRAANRNAEGNAGACSAAAANVHKTTTSTVCCAQAPKDKWRLIHGIQHAFSLKKVDRRFLWTSLFVRVVLFPAMCLALLYLLNFFVKGKLQDGGVDGHLCVLALILDLISPTTTNTLYYFHGDKIMQRQWEKLLKYQYLLCPFFMAGWSAVSFKLLGL